mgnify:CR=1 FL=1
MELAELTDDRVKLLVSKQEEWFCDTNAGRLMDISCGNQTYIWGYSHFFILAAIQWAQRNVSWVNYKSSESCEQVDSLTNSIVKESGLHSVAWAVSGTDAVELALYIKNLYYNQNNPNRQSILSFTPGYSGTSFLPAILRGEFQVPWCYNVDTGVWPTIEARQSYEERALQQVEDKLRQHADIGTVFMESMPWIEKFRPWSDSWWYNIRELCDKYNCLMVVDDVMGGYGKTGPNKFTHTTQGVMPDIVTSGKSITAGFAPLSTVCMSEDVTRAVINKFGFSHTWSPNMAGVGAANWIYRNWLEDIAWQDAQQHFESMVADRINTGHIKQGWHKGLVCSMELVKPITQLDLLQAGIMPSGLDCYYDNNHLTICAPVGAYWEVMHGNLYWDQLNERLDRALGNT